MQPTRPTSTLVAHDVASLACFDREYRSRVWAIAFRMTRDEWDAEEVVQDVLWTVYRKADSFRGDTDVWHWIRRVTQNAARMLLRKRRRRPMPIEDDAIETYFTNDAMGIPLDRAESATGAKRAAVRLQDALGEQEATNKELFIMMDVDGLEKEEVADRLGLSVSAVKARLHRVRKALRAAASEGIDSFPAAA
jgi:RNA polymerase sigma-70 factor (ECF subfamily)